MEPPPDARLVDGCFNGSRSARRCRKCARQFGCGGEWWLCMDASAHVSEILDFALFKWFTTMSTCP